MALVLLTEVSNSHFTQGVSDLGGQLKELWKSNKSERQGDYARWMFKAYLPSFQEFERVFRLSVTSHSLSLVLAATPQNILEGPTLELLGPTWQPPATGNYLILS